MFPCTHRLLVAKKGSAVAFLIAQHKLLGAKLSTAGSLSHLQEEKKKKKKLFFQPCSLLSQRAQMKPIYKTHFKNTLSPIWLSGRHDSLGFLTETFALLEHLPWGCFLAGQNVIFFFFIRQKLGYHNFCWSKDTAELLCPHVDL